jgi:hypothetical protein
MLSLLMAAVLAAPQFEVQTLSGETAKGSLAAITRDSLALQTESGERSFAVKDLLSASAVATPPANARAAVLAELIDGTRIPAESVQSAGGTVTLKRSGEHTLQVPVKQLRWIRTFAPDESNAQWDGTWADLISGDAAGDVLVVRNKGNLVATDGVVGDISAESVAFTLDENKLDVKRTKVEGIIFAKTAHDDLPEAICAVGDSTGAHWQVKEIHLQGEQVQLTTPAGIEFAVPLSSVSKLDFSQGKLVYLSDLETESFEYQPFFSLTAPLDAISGFYRLRRDVGLEKQPLELDGTVYRKGLAMHSRSKAVYRLPGKFRTFKAIVGIDDHVRNVGGDVLLEISGDGKSLWKGNVRGGEGAQSLELDVNGVKRLEILADYGAGEDVADHLDLCEAKVVK